MEPDGEISFPRVNNLKVHITLTNVGKEKLFQSLSLPPLSENIKFCNNLFVARGINTYIVFPASGYVNITGVKNFSMMDKVIPNFCSFFQLDKTDVASNVIIDNISATGNFGQKINLTKLKEKFGKAEGQGQEIYLKVSYNRNSFPGAFCRTQFGTATLFANGKYVLVGIGCQENMTKLFLKMRALIRTL